MKETVSSEDREGNKRKNQSNMYLKSRMRFQRRKNNPMKIFKKKKVNQNHLFQKLSIKKSNRMKNLRQSS